jgi:hypothetical protein
MTLHLRSIARRLFGVTRPRTYYLPWIIRPGLECALVLSNVEARFRPAFSAGPFPVTIVQYDAQGNTAHRYDVTLADSTDTIEVPLRPASGGCGFVTVSGDRLRSDLYVTLSDGHDYTATHGREEFIEGYPGLIRFVMRTAGAMAFMLGRTVPVFTRNQFVYLGPESRSHVLLMNLSDVTNRIRAVASAGGRPVGSRLIRLPPRGSHLLEVTSLGSQPATGTIVWRLRLKGNAWFNLYMVGAGSKDLAGPLSLMHVK